MNYETELKSKINMKKAELNRLKKSVGKMKREKSELMEDIRKLKIEKARLIKLKVYNRKMHDNMRRPAIKRVEIQQIRADRRLRNIQENIHMNK